MGQQYPYSKIWEKILRQLSVFMELEPFFYFFMITKTLNLSCKKYKLVQLDQYSPRISNVLWDNNIDTPQYGRKVLWQFFMFMELEPFSYYFISTKTLNLSHVKQKYAHLNQYSPIKMYQRLYGTTISKIYKMGENVVVVLHIYGVLAIFILFCDHQYTEFK